MARAAGLPIPTARNIWMPCPESPSRHWVMPTPGWLPPLPLRPGECCTPPTCTAFREQEQLADKLCALSGMEEVFFGNSGAEANEAAIKLARFYGHKKGVELPDRHRHGKGLPRPHHGHPVGDRQSQGAGRLRAAGRPVSSGCLTATWRQSGRLPSTTRTSLP